MLLQSIIGIQIGNRNFCSGQQPGQGFIHGLFLLVLTIAQNILQLLGLFFRFFSAGKHSGSLHAFFKRQLYTKHL